MIDFRPAGFDAIQTRLNAKPIEAMSHDELLLTAIDRLSGQLPTLRPKSLESSALIMVKLIQVHRERNPQTIEDLVRICVKLGFRSSDFFDKLDQAWESMDDASD